MRGFGQLKNREGPMGRYLEGRASAQLKLALLNDCGCLKTLADLEQEARRSGLTGAEIDIALEGRSFEARTAAALAYACALKSGENELVEAARKRAAQIGVSDDELEEVMLCAQAIIASMART